MVPSAPRVLVALVVLAGSAFASAACRRSDPPNAEPAVAESSASAQHHAANAGQRAKIGEPAPNFSLKDLDGNVVELAQLRGKIVVLEWFNPECPFVRRNHTKGPLKDMARELTAKGVVVGDKTIPVVWLAVNSGAPGKQGHGIEVNRAGKERYGMTHPILLDEDGAVGHAYGAKNTPHMFVIDPEGKLLYAGAIDNAQDGDTPNGAPFVNYIEAALADFAAGRPVAIAETPAYGCSVKYAR